MTIITAANIMYKTLGFKWFCEAFCPASAFATADREVARNPQRFIHVTVMGKLNTTQPIEMNYEETAEKIVRLKNADLEFREKLIQSGRLGEGYNEEMANLHSRNAKILDEIIDAIGYPTVDKVGKEASEAAWLVIQHSIGQPDFMKKCVKLLEVAVSENKANSRNLAYLTDRVAVFEGKPQLYGTQFDWDENEELNPNDFDDLIKVNQRRKSIGLNSIEEQTDIIRKQAKIENQRPPTDLEKRKEEFEQWKKSVGWIK